MIRSLLLIFLFNSLFSCGQNTSNAVVDWQINQDSIDHLKKCIAFIKEVNAEKLSDTKFILADNPFAFEYFDCIEEVLADTVTFTKAELSVIKDKKYQSLPKWTNGFFEHIKLVSGDTINAIFKDRSKGWKYFRKNIGKSYNTFSVPIFLRNDNWCLFYLDIHCDSLCGLGQLVLYKRANNKWIKIKSYCNWIS